MHLLDSPSPQTPPPETDNALDDFIGTRLPDWLKRASSNQIRRLRGALSAHQASQARLRGRTLQLLPLQRFAKQHFATLLTKPLPDGVAFEQLEWLTVLPEFTDLPLQDMPAYGPRETRESGLLRLMHNFADGTSFYDGSGLVAAGQSEVLSKPGNELVQACRQLDVGRLYQLELARTYDAATQELLAQDKRSGLRLATEMAALNGQISAAEQLALRDLLDTEQVHTQYELKGYPGLMQMLGQPVVDGALIHLRDRHGAERGVLVYLPSDPIQPLRRYASSAAMNAALAVELKAPGYRAHFTRLISLERRAEFVDTLAKRLQDNVADLQLEGRVQTGDVFQAMASEQVQRLQDDARLLLVPTANADAVAAKARRDAWKAAGLDLFNLSGLFLPAVGAQLLAGVVTQTLGAVFEGVSEWSLGHQHEALEHLLGVAATLVATAGTVAAVAFVRCAYLEAMEWVSSDGETLRLWPNDLEAFAVSPEHVTLQADGRFSDGQRHWIRVGQRLHELYQAEPNGVYRLRHPSRPGAYEPVVLHNGERCWQLLYHRAQAETGAARMLDTLWPEAQLRSAAQARWIMRAADVDEEALRGLLVENRRTPINLRDTLERFAADARIEAFFESLRQLPASVSDQALLRECLARPEVADAAQILARQSELRGALFEHLTQAPAGDDELVQLLRKTIAGLPEAHAQALAGELSASQREQALAQERLSLKTQTRALALARMARFNRAMTGLYAPSAYTDDTGVLAMTLLDKLQVAGLRLTLSKDIEQSAALAAIGAEDESAGHWLLVRDQGVFKVFDDTGAQREVAASDDIFAALVGVLDARKLSSILQLEGEQAAAQLRDKLLAQLPETRQGVASLLGWPGQHIWFNPGRRLADGRVGYPLSGRGAGRLSQRAMLRDGLRQYFPGLNDAQLELELQIRWRRGVRVEAVLGALEDDLGQLTRSVNDWVGFALDDVSRHTRQMFAERLLRAWRGVGDMPMHGAAEQRLGLRLSFSDLPVATLPELPLQVDFFHVKALVITDAPLSHVHAGFIRAFTDVQRLDLSHNHLLRCPDGLGYLSNLRRLRLVSNQIHLDANAVEALSRLPMLSHLDLSDNHAVGAFALPFQHLSQLIELRMRRCGLSSWPKDIALCDQLTLVDLRNNALRGAPREILNMPQAFREGLLVEGNRMSMTELANLAAFDPVREAPEYEQGRAGWVGTGSRGVARGKIWDALQAQVGNVPVFNLLEGLEQVAEHSWPKAFLDEHVWRILALMHADAGFAQTVRVLLQPEPVGSNRILEQFSRLLQQHAESQAEATNTSLSGAQLLALGKGLFRLARLESFVQADIQARGVNLAQDAQGMLALRYRVRLRRVLALPFQPYRLYEVGVPSVEQAQLDAARDAVGAAITPQVLAPHLCRYLFWQRFVERYDSAAFAALALAADRQPLRERLTLEFMQRMARIEDDSERGVGR